MKMIVSAASRMFRAISFGVLRRDALSTRPIMRSRNVSPGLAVMRTTMRSDSTLVPPVTALRSPPASRITGADSPVMADSSIDAMPSITSPSPGTMSPASQTTRSPLCRAVEATFSSRPLTSRRAMLSDRVLRNAAACALPRPSATASAKLANRTVNQSQMVIWPTNSSLLLPLVAGAPLNRPAMNTIVVMTEPTSTTNITGLRAIHRGFSFLKLAPIAGTRMARSVRLLPRPRRRWRSWTFSFISLVQVSCSQLELLEDGPKRKRREERERADDQDHADEQADEERPIGGKCARAGRNDLLARERAGQGEDGDHLEEAPDPQRRRAGGVVVDRVSGQAREGAAVV